MSTLDKFVKFAQLNLWPCKVCANIWWFDMPRKYECTKCGHYELKEQELSEL